MASSKPPRQPRLRASCDGCFLAKVKCSKARPICLRCLQVGLECRYSPSTRAGKPKASDLASRKAHTTEKQSCARLGEESPAYLELGYHANSATVPSQWTHSSSRSGDRPRRNAAVMANVAYLDIDEQTFAASAPAGMLSFCAPLVPWSSSCTDFPSQLSDQKYPDRLSNSHDPTTALDLKMPFSGWTEPPVSDMVFFGDQLPTPTSIGSELFSSPESTPSIRPIGHHHQSSYSGSEAPFEACTCIDQCLHALQALQSVSAPKTTSFDKLLSANQAGVSSCINVLNCRFCKVKPDSPTLGLLLASILAEVSSSYRLALQTRVFEKDNSAFGHFLPSVQDCNDSHDSGISATSLNSPFSDSAGHYNADLFDDLLSGSSLDLDLASYQVQDNDSCWHELDLLRGEIAKLDNLYGRFKRSQVGLKDQELSSAVIGYLGRLLQPLPGLIALHCGKIDISQDPNAGISHHVGTHVDAQNCHP